MQNLKFRIYHKNEEEMYKWDDPLFPLIVSKNIFDNPDYEITLSTGLFDKNRKEVYEGDKIKFKYWIGDFAWEGMAKKERKRQARNLNKEYVGYMTWYQPLLSFQIICGSTEKTHVIFPGLYGGGEEAEVIGNIYT